MIPLCDTSVRDWPDDLQLWHYRTLACAQAPGHNFGILVQIWRESAQEWLEFSFFQALREWKEKGDVVRDVEQWAACNSFSAVLCSRPISTGLRPGLENQIWFTTSMM